MRKILVIEDDENLLMLMKLKFKNEINTEFVYANSYAEGINQIASGSFDLYILDINLEGFSGLTILQLLQKEKNIDNRVIVMSGEDNIETKIQSYNLGASNFLLKPIHFDLLKAILRKNIRTLDTSHEGILKTKNLTLNTKNYLCSITDREDLKEVILTSTEYRVLYTLITSKNVIIKKEDLSYLGKDDKDPMSFKALEMHIASIRKKIGFHFIRTVRGIGYIFED